MAEQKGEMMKDKKPEKKMPAYVPVLWLFTTAMWTVVAGVNFTNAEFPRFWLALQCATAALSGAAAIVNYLRYKRGRDDNSN